MILDVLNGRTPKRIPFWFMRQAGRYLPEYHEQFKKRGNFLEVCYDSDIAAEITLQPVERFDLDAAILFADILLLPNALGCNLKFIPELGPSIHPIDPNFFGDTGFLSKLEPVFNTVKKVKSKLKKEKTLIGFAGSPWTVLAYMIEGKSSSNFVKARTWAYKNKKAFQRILDLVTESTIEYLKEQISSGVDVVQLFDSWSGVLSVDEFHSWVIKPTRKITAEIKPVIGFPKGAGVMYRDYAEITGVRAISLDYSVPLEWARDNLQQHVILQGNLNPMLLAYDIDRAILESKRVLRIIGNKPFIFNLGHGMIKDTPLDNVYRLVDFLRNT